MLLISNLLHSVHVSIHRIRLYFLWVKVIKKLELLTHFLLVDPYPQLYLYWNRNILLCNSFLPSLFMVMLGIKILPRNYYPFRFSILLRKNTLEMHLQFLHSWLVLVYICNHHVSDHYSIQCSWFRFSKVLDCLSRCKPDH